MSSELAKAALKAVDLKPVDALAALREKLMEIETRLEQMSNMAGKVSDEVFARVREDYETRRDSVISEARPLYEQVLAEYQKLKAVLGDLQNTEKRARLSREEIDFRHMLGEFDEAEKKQRLAAVESEVGDSESVLAEVNTMRDRFIAAVGDESELDGAPAEGEAEVVAVVETSVEIDSGEQPTGQIGAVTLPPVPQIQIPDIAPVTLQAPVPRMAEVPPARPAPPPVPSTMVLQAIKLPLAGTEAAGVPGASPPKPGRLVPQNPEAGRQTHVATVKVLTVGADPSSDVRIGGPGIENRHAELRPSAVGFTLVDLDTRHGTRVNGERINSRLLEDEDVVLFGAARFVFRLS